MLNKSSARALQVPSTMGRTQRKRRRETVRNFHTCDDDKELILLNSWLSRQGMRSNRKLVLAVFNDTGRGVLTKKKIYAGEELMNLPLNSTLNVTTILMDKAFCSLFSVNTKNILLEYKQTVSFQSLMAFYLVFLKVQGSETKWHVYLESLPKSYTVPYFLPNELYNYITSDVLGVVTKQKDIIRSSFHIFEDILKTSFSTDLSVLVLKGSFRLPLYEWAYFTVNTRCVYMDLTKLIDLINIDKSVLNIIDDNTKIAMCPYLDMINHSPNAKNETKLMVAKDIENISISSVSKELFTDVSFSIYTRNNFDPFTQLFICYGDSHNLKLITEYGFYLPSLELDFYSFTFETISKYLDENSKELSQEQMSFINNHGLNKDLYIDCKGLSFNLYGLLMVVKYYYCKNMDVSRLIYSAALGSNDRLLNEIITSLVSEKLVNVKLCVSKLEKYEENDILGNCVALMHHYVEILEKFIKC